MNRWFQNLWNHTRMLNRIRRRAPDRAARFGERPRGAPRPFRLGVLAIMKNEAHLIEEWLQHYLSFGADRIYLIDNGSTDDTLKKIEPWLTDGRVAVLVLPEQHKQVEHYWTAFQHFKSYS
ncbi:MAG: glycosyltransferase family 2 protein [Tabrizicola sp.]|nr:glycosyltransferase family 2 protein [Tabrizicola sp.]